MKKELLIQGKEAYNNKDYKTAAVLYEKAMEAGSARAMNFLAGMYLSGVGVKKDEKKAYELFKKAAEAGDKLAINTANILGLIHLPSPAEQWRCCVEEVHELRKEGKYQEAMHKYVILASEDSELPYEYQAECMYWIGMMYKSGQGVPHNDKLAKLWLRKAADKNYSIAIDALELDNPLISFENGQAKVTTYIKQKHEYIKSAEILARLAQLFKAEIKIHVKDKTANAKSILEVANIGLVCDTVVDITAKGEDAEEAVMRIVNLIASNFNLEDDYISKLIFTGKINMLNDSYKTVKGAEGCSEVVSVNDYAKATTYVKNMICFRPATIFAQLAGVFKSDIRLRAREKTYMIDAKSIIMIAGFGLTKGTKVEIYAEGMDAKEAVTRLTNLIDSGFDLQDEYIANLVNQGKIKFFKYPLFMYNQNGPLLPILSCWENGSTESNNE